MLLILGAGYIGAAVAELALERGRGGRARRQLAHDRARAARRARGAPARGWRPPTSATARRSTRCSPAAPRRVLLLAAQASRPISEREPDYTEETNLTGARRVAEAVAASAADRARARQLAARLRRPARRARSGPDAPYGEQGDLAHLSKIYAELALGMHARRGGFGLANCRLGIVYGPSPVEHDAPDSQTVVDKFRRLAAAGEPLTLDGGGRATIGAVHVADAARLLLDCPVPRAGRDRRLQPRRGDADGGRRRRARRGPRAGRRRRVDARAAAGLRAPVAGYLGRA